MAATNTHAPVLGPAGEPCSVCGESLAGDQRYCLNCGERRCAPRLDPLAHVRERGGEHRGSRAEMSPRARRPATAWPLPTPRVAGVATLLVLGFGIVAGAAAGPRAGSTLASTTARRTIVVAEAPAPAPPDATQPTSTTTAKPEARSTPPPEPSRASSSETAITPDTPTPTNSTPDTSTPAADNPATKRQKTTPTDQSGDSSTAKPTVATVKHVWIVALTGHTMDEALAQPSPMPYLSGTLRPKGLLLSKYKAVGSGALANLIALVSGQATTADQRAGCATYADVDGKAKTGCVFPKSVDTLPDQLTTVGRTWRAYVEDADAGQPPDTCHHPAQGAPLDPVMARNPLLFFHAIVDTPDCGANVAGISRLAPDTRDAESAPTLSLVIPNACHDGVDQPCAPDAPAGLGAADAWLKEQLDPLLASKAYADDGVVVLTFDVGPDAAAPIGALVLSGSAKAGTVSVKSGGTDDGAYSHANLLRTLEDLFSLDALGLAKHARALSVTKPSP